MTTAEREEMPAAQWRVLATAVTERFLAHLDLDSVTVPRGARALLKLPKAFSLTKSGTDGGVARQIVTTLAVYGETGQAGSAAAEFGAFPLATHRVPDPGTWQAAIHVAWYFARRRGDSATAGALAGLLDAVPRARLSPAYFDGTILRDPLDQPAEMQAVGSDRLRASSYLLQIGTLASMAAYGGSATYPATRIDVEVDRYLAALFALPGFAPEEGTT